MVKSDVVVLGGGPGGYLAAERAAQGGLSVTLIEKRSLGGTCLNEGCIPSKCFLNSGKLYAHAKDSKAFGVTTTGAKIDHAQVVKRKNKVVKTLVSGVGTTMKSCGVNVVMSEGVIKAKTADGFVVEADGEQYAGGKLIIASGSVPTIPPIPGLKEGLESGFVMTSREILDLETPPKKLAVIGGGVIGLELACYFSMIGVKVTILEMLQKIAGPTEAEVSELLLNTYKKRGIDFKLGCAVTEIGKDCVKYKEGDAQKEEKADLVLCCIGRRANTQGIGLENIGVYTERGAIVTDEHMLTNIPDVYAIGDANGKIMLAHTAYREAEVAVNNILGKKDVMRYSAISSVIYTDPEIASVGETRQSAEAKGISVREVKVPMVYAGRYVAEVEKGEGFIKLVVDTKKNFLIGCHMIGSYASEMIYGVALMIERQMTIDQIKELVFPHPTVSEVIREALFKL